MPRVQFNTFVAYDVKMAWGYPVEVTPEGVFGDVPDELLQLELDAGRVKRIESKQVADTKPKTVPEVVEQTPVEEVEVVVEQTPVEEVELPKDTTAEDVIENGTGKRRGRPPKSEGSFGE